MPFTHDTANGLIAAADLVNTATASGGDTLTTVADLDNFFARNRYTGFRARDEAEVAAVRGLRPRLRRLWELPEPAVVAEVNRMLREADAVPQLIEHDDEPWHIHAVPLDAPYATRILVETAMAFVDLIRAGELDRLRHCAADDCDDVVIDLSRNRSKRFCDSGCGNRANVAAYRARRRSTG